MAATEVQELTIDAELASLLPDLTAMQLTQLEASLEKDGWRKEQAIVLWANHNDTIVDGMNRYRICKRLGIPFKTTAKTFEDRDAVKEWIHLNAAGQRNMTPDQEAANRGAIYNLRKKRDGERGPEKLGQNEPAFQRTSEAVAAEFGVGEATIRRDGKYAEALDTVAAIAGNEVKQAILSGAVKASKSDVVKLAAADKKQQKSALKALDSGKASSLKEALRLSEQIIPISQISESETGVCGDLAELNGKKFGCIYADPPWAYSNQATRASTDNHYCTMSVDDLCAMPVQSLAADDAHLHLWTTNAFLFDAKRVIDAWGFEFRSVFVWVKPQMGIGNYWRVSHEFLLTAVRGDAKRFNVKNLMSWGQFDRGQHSAKPEQVRGMIEKASPGHRLELFGRKAVDGWTIYGNQIDNSKRLFA